MGDASLKHRPYPRRRRDRVAHQVACTITLGLLLLILGGVWWLVSPPEARATGGHIDPLLLLTPAPQHPAVQPPHRPAMAKEPAAVAETAVVSASVPEARPTGPVFNGRPLRKTRTIRMLVTAYSPDERSCGKWADNITASGYSVWTNGMKLVAADTRILPFGSIISIPGYDEGAPVPVLDRGGAIKGHRLDVLFPTHEIARKWGKRWVDVIVWRYAD